jgi:hypothetical protein
VAGCWGRVLRRWRRCRSTRARVCDRSPRVRQSRRVTVVDHGKRWCLVDVDSEEEVAGGSGARCCAVPVFIDPAVGRSGPVTERAGPSGA